MESLMEEWQKRLGLEDWKIKLHTNLRQDEMTCADAEGNASYEESTKTARIELLDPAWYGERIIPYDIEKTLVHELLHLKLSLLFGGDNLLERIAHQWVDDLARAFVDAKRQGQKHE